eukprot:12012129-Alexandrium_andersonii.AAC.1
MVHDSELRGSGPLRRPPMNVKLRAAVCHNTACPTAPWICGGGPGPQGRTLQLAGCRPQIKLAAPAIAHCHDKDW